jgi:hypothetical protein
MKRIFCAVLMACSFSATAGETMFGYLYTTDTIPQGKWEYEQVQTLRTGKARGSYTAIDLRNEFEYGVTDKFQTAFYLNSSYLKSTNQYDPEMPSDDLPDHNEFDVDGMSVEFIYRLLSPYTDPIGLALYVEPEIAIRDHMMGDDHIERSVEMRVILQSNFLDDQLITAFNFMVEPEWEKVDGLVKKELWAELTLGASYRIASKWYLGLEGRNHMEFIDMNLADQEHSAYFLGPNVHYGDQKWWIQFTVLPQIWGWPRDLGLGKDGTEISSPNNHLGQHENLEVRAKFALVFW